MSSYNRSPESRYSRGRYTERSRSRSRSPLSKSDARKGRERQRKSRWHDDDRRGSNYQDKSYYHHDDRNQETDRGGHHDERKSECRSVSKWRSRFDDGRRLPSDDSDTSRGGGGSRNSGGGRRYNKYDDYDHFDEDDSASHHRSKQASSVPPGPILMFRNLSSFILKEHLTQALGHQMSYIKDIRMITGRENSSNYAFVEFYATDDAINWMEANKNGFEVRGCHVNIDFSHHRSIDGGEKRKKEFKWSDWNCFKCGTLNFSRRTVCLTCDCLRTESDSLHEDRRAGILPDIEAEEESMKNNPPSNVLIFRGLDGLSTEETIRSSIAEVSDIKIKDVRLIKDKATNTSRRFCFVETITAEEAAELNKVLQEQNPAFFVDGRRINVSYARVNTSVSKPANAVAAAAIQQAQAMNAWITKNRQPQQQQQQQYYSQGSSNASVSVESSSQSTSDQTTTTSTAATSNIPSTYLYDATSGFYYDSMTGLYYDPKTQYHYNSQTGQYCYYDNTKQAYIPVSSDGSPIVSTDASANDQSKEKKKSDVSAGSKTGKNAKKIAKDMERWAKSINTQKAQQQQLLNQVVAQSQQVAQQLQQAQMNDQELHTGGIQQEQTLPLSVEQVSVAMEKPSVVYVEGEDDMLPSGGGDMEFVDKTTLACLLCKRKFNSLEQLMKHVQLSDLHKQNLEKYRKANELSQADQAAMYRDRAKERRAKYGTDAIVPGWKKRFERERAKTATDEVTEQQPMENEQGTENIGSKMLKAMGWNEGQGLGREGQGIVKPIEAEKRTPNAGLGTPGSNYGGGGIYSSGNDYRATLKSLTKARYDQMFDN